MHTNKAGWLNYVDFVVLCLTCSIYPSPNFLGPSGGVLNGIRALIAWRTSLDTSSNCSVVIYHFNSPRVLWLHMRLAC